jgi:formate/nitrite transporter FocA (FNT family)
MNRQSTFAGILIGLGACGFLALGGIPGAVIFAFGLVGVVLTGTPLYTGRAGVMPVKELPDLARIWFFNILACAVIGLVIWSLGGESVERAKTVVAGRLAQGPWRSFLRAVGCGLIIDIACWTYRSTKNLAPVLFGVPLFIVCGFYHSIADVVYIFAAGSWDAGLLWYYPMIVLGNYAGCNIRRALLPKDFAIK